jgi:hypothetical protein
MDFTMHSLISWRLSQLFLLEKKLLGYGTGEGRGKGGGKGGKGKEGENREIFDKF